MTWYALKVRPGALQRRRYGDRLRFPVERDMELRGIAPFIPVESHWIQRTRYHKRQKERVRRALLPGMIFVETWRPEELLPALRSAYVSGLWSLNGNVEFPEAAISRLRAISDSLYRPDYYRPMPTHRGYEVGDTVEVVEGPLKSIGRVKVTAIVGERARFLADLLGTTREVEADAAFLAKAAE